MADDGFRGIEANQEQRARQLVRDTRPLLHRFFDFIRDSENAAMVCAILGILPMVFPVYFDICFLFGLLTFTGAITKKSALPFRMPQACGQWDHGDPLPASSKPRKARGICFFGNDRKTSHELWFNNDDMRTHVLIFGSTGSGKTEALISISYNALIQGSGFIYVDGKGDNSLFAKVFSMCRSMGREDDLLLINFMTGARDIVGPQKSRLSNTMNPFSRGSSGMLTNLVVSMMDSSGSGQDGDMWKGRAISFVEALMKILVYMRDQGHILLDANSIRLYFSLPKLEQIAIDKKFPVDDERAVPIDDAPDVVIEPIFNYLQTLPGYNVANKGKQSGEVWEQHGFITMQLTKIFSSLADTYGHIIRVNLAEVDFRDIVLNRRILVVLLPALEKSPEELSNLGKIIVASLKGMMASGLGDEVEGTYREVIERKPTNSPTPYLCVLDEYGYYAVEGFAVVPAQARSLGFSAIFAGQDLPAFQKASKEEAASIGANTNIKLCMKLEDPTDTFEFFQKTAGQAYVTRTAGFQTNASNLTNTYLDNKSAQIEKQDRIELADLKDQREGEAHFFFKSKIIRGRLFFANPPPTPRLKINQMLKIEDPDDALVQRLAERMYKFEDIFNQPALMHKKVFLDEDLMLLRQAIDADEQENLLATTAHAIQSLYQSEMEEEHVYDVEEEQDPDFSGMDIFTQANTEFPDLDDFDPLSLLNMPALLGPLLDKRETKRQIEKIERFMGNSKAEAGNIADKLIGDLRIATHYPPSKIQPFDEQEAINTIDELINHLTDGEGVLTGETRELPAPEFDPFAATHSAEEFAELNSGAMFSDEAPSVKQDDPFADLSSANETLLADSSNRQTETSAETDHTFADPFADDFLQDDEEALQRHAPPTADAEEEDLSPFADPFATQDPFAADFLQQETSPPPHEQTSLDPFASSELFTDERVLLQEESSEEQQQDATDDASAEPTDTSGSTAEDNNKEQ